MKLGAAIAVALALSAAPAQAAPFTPSLDYAYSLAIHHWGAEPSCTSIDKQILPHESLQSPDTRGEATQPQPGETPGACILFIDRELAEPNLWEQACAIMRHEVGHLLGYGHSTNPQSIMYPQITFIPSECTDVMLWLMNHPHRFPNT